MSDHERGAYTPPTDAPLSFDARQPVRGSRPIPFTLIISILVLLGLAAAIFVFYRSGVRQAGQPPQTVGAPVAGMKTPAPAEAQPQDPAAGLQIYKTEGGKGALGPSAPQFTAPPEQPQARAE
ncbi:MAG TPA: SPOR domain-containing protein, partial [Phenylobacterium sp.]|nr:SPOR domain-containing protein [Phenylobacterium sp.]